MKTLPNFRFRDRRPSGLGEGRFTYCVDNVHFCYLGMIEGKPGVWHDAALVMGKKEIRENAPSYKTREEAAQAIYDNFYGAGKPL